MNRQTLGLFLGEAGDVTVLGFFVNIVLAAICAGILAKVYVRFGRSLSNRPAFAHNFLLIVVTTFLVISIVKSSLALSLGLIGALSIVRFRAAIKEPEELTYLFLAIAIGLGFGANQRVITLGAFVAILILLVVRQRLHPFEQIWEQGSYLNVRSNSQGSVTVNQMIDILERTAESFKIKRVDSDKETVEAVFIVTFRDIAGYNAAERNLRDIDPDVVVNYLDNSSVALEAGSR
jgi:uncharacterized membrane protein YhiD involved in acid resistance